MAEKKSQSKKEGGAGIIAAELGAGVLAAAAVGAGYYFYGSKGAKKHRAAASKWMKSFKDDVAKEAKKAGQLNKRVISSIVSRATKTYETAKNVKREDLLAAAEELKANWKELQAELESAGKKGVKSMAKPVKKAEKVATKKTATKKAVTKKK